MPHFIPHKSSTIIISSHRCKSSWRSMVHGWTPYALLLHRQSGFMRPGEVIIQYALLTPRSHHYEKKNEFKRSIWSYSFIISEEYKDCKWHIAQRIQAAPSNTYTETILSWFNKLPSSTPLLDLNKSLPYSCWSLLLFNHRFIPCHTVSGQKLWWRAVVFHTQEFSPAPAPQATFCSSQSFCPTLLIITISTNAFMYLKTWILWTDSRFTTSPSIDSPSLTLQCFASRVGQEWPSECTHPLHWLVLHQ